MSLCIGNAQLDTSTFIRYTSIKYIKKNIRTQNLIAVGLEKMPSLFVSGHRVVRRSVTLDTITLRQENLKT